MRIDSLEEEIAKLNRELRCELVKKSVTVEEMLHELTFLPMALRREYQESIKKEIANLDTSGSIAIDRIFHLVINPLTTFLDYKLLEHLISKFGSTQLQHDMMDYVSEVNKFKSETTVAELIDQWDGIEDKSLNYTELKALFGEDPCNCTLEKLDKHRKKFCSRYKLSELVMILIHLKPGSFIAVWQIPTVLVGVLMESIRPLDDKFFNEEDIVSLSLAGKRVYPVISHQHPGFTEEVKKHDIMAAQYSRVGNDLIFYTWLVHESTFSVVVVVVVVWGGGGCGGEDCCIILFYKQKMVVRPHKDLFDAPYVLSQSRDPIVVKTKQQPSTSHRETVMPQRESQKQAQPTVIVRSGVENRVSVKLRWRRGERAPKEMYRESDAVVSGSMMFLNPADNEIYAYDATCATKGWSQLPKCPHEWCSLAVVNKLLTTVGGGILTPTNKLFSLTGEGNGRRWTEKFPPMPTMRSNTTSLCTKTSLIVVGGDREIFNPLATVEVMNTETYQWSRAANLFHPVTNASAAVCGDRIYVMNRFSSSVYTCSLSVLLQSCSSLSSHLTSALPSSAKASTNVWSQITDAPVCNTTCVSLNGELLAIGGSGLPNRPTTAIHMYDTTTDSWTVISHMSTARSSCFAAVLPDNQLMVVGGICFPYIIDFVEIAKIIA